MKKPKITFVGVDIESIGTHPFDGVVWMVSITYPGKKPLVYHDCYGMKSLPDKEKKMLADPNVCKIIHSSQMDGPYIELNLGVKVKNIWDTELCETIILGYRPKFKKKKGAPTPAEERVYKKWGTGLQYVKPRYGCKEPNKSIRENFIDRPKGKPFTKQEINYAADDTVDLHRIQKMQEVVLTRDSLIEVALLENTVAERYHDMRVRGIGFSKEIWREVNLAVIRDYKERMKKLPGEVSNWNSPAQVKQYFKRKGILIDTFDDLDKMYLQTHNKVLGDFIATREYATAISRYGLDWLDKNSDNYFIDGDGRIRCNITQIINTGRNAFSAPNLQQLPGSGNSDPLRLKVLEIVTGGAKKKPQHRRAFVPAPGNVFVIGDFSGQEIGIMAAASGESLWIDALLRGDDVHGLTASIVDPGAWAEGTIKGCTFPKKCKCPEHRKQREPAKINNFMLAYGGGPQKFSEFMGVPLVQASKYCGAHKRAVPTLDRYLRNNGIEAIATGVSYSADPYRRRRVLIAEEEWQIRNQGMNNPIQSAGANMLKLAMASLPWKYPIVLVIHDEIICEVPAKLAKECALALKSVMEKAADYITGIKGLIRVEPKIQMNIMKDLPETKKIAEIKNGAFALTV